MSRKSGEFQYFTEVNKCPENPLFSGFTWQSRDLLNLRNSRQDFQENNRTEIIHKALSFAVIGAGVEVHGILDLATLINFGTSSLEYRRVVKSENRSSISEKQTDPL